MVNETLERNGAEPSPETSPDFELPPEAFCQEPVTDPLEGERAEEKFPPPPEQPPPQPPPVSGEKILSLLEGAVEVALRVPCRLPDEWRQYAGEILDAVGPPALVPARPPSPKARWKWLLGVGGAYLGLVLFRGIALKRELGRIQAQQQPSPEPAAEPEDNVEPDRPEEEQDEADHPAGSGLESA